MATVTVIIFGHKFKIKNIDVSSIDDARNKIAATIKKTMIIEFVEPEKICDDEIVDKIKNIFGMK